MNGMAINRKVPSEEDRWFGISIGHTTKVILFFFSLRGILYSTRLWLYISNINVLSQIFGYNSEFVFRNIIILFIEVILATLYIYTLIICATSRKKANEVQKDMNSYLDDVQWFGFKLLQTSATLLFCLSLIGIIPTVNNIYYILAEFLNPLSPQVGVALAGNIHFLIIDLLMLFIYLYSIVKFIQVKKKIKL